ncbi:unnamed protein product [Phaeothamnion confervicola]
MWRDIDLSSPSRAASSLRAAFHGTGIGDEVGSWRPACCVRQRLWFQLQHSLQNGCVGFFLRVQDAVAYTIPSLVLREIFQEIVALAAARSALSHWAPAVDISTPALLALDNSYFVLLRSLHWTPRDWSGPALYQDGSGALTVDPLDRALIEDSSFKAHVDAYGANDRKFRRNYAAALQKLQKR